MPLRCAHSYFKSVEVFSALPVERDLDNRGQAVAQRSKAHGGGSKLSRKVK